MERIAVESSQIMSCGYDPAARKMEVEFKSFNPTKPTSVYEYENVEQEVADGFFRKLDDKGAKWSVGKHFGATLKKDPEKYPYKRLSPPKG